MDTMRPLITVAIPAYGRKSFLEPLLESISSQLGRANEIVICEDNSNERQEIRRIVDSFIRAHPSLAIRYYENAINLGYDGNIRELISKANGNYVFFMGNDDLMADGALRCVEGILRQHSDIGILLKSYSWFSSDHLKPDQDIFYYRDNRRFKSGSDAMKGVVRKCGVISGLIIDRDMADELKTKKYDGSLFYQIYLASRIALQKDCIYVKRVLVHCRSTEVPLFGNASTEAGFYSPGSYTPQARVKMVSSALGIIREQCRNVGLEGISREITREYARTSYSTIRDQLRLGLKEYVSFCRQLGRESQMQRYPEYWLWVVLGYILKERWTDRLLRVVRILIKGIESYPSA